MKNEKLNEKIEKIVSSMNLDEKIAIGSGKDFWHLKSYPQYNISEVMVCDGPHGLRKLMETADKLSINDSIPATCFPTASISGCSFDENLMEQMGEAIGKEALANDVSVILGPGANIKRSPLCGRNFEYFSEDPIVSGKMAAAQIRGIEKTGCGASLKHFALNNQEKMRFSSNSIVDEKTMREIYLKSFEIAVKEGKPSTIMSSYNRINSVHSSDNKWLLKDVLRNEWGFDGLVMTDWGGMFNRIEGFKAGCDLSMPGGSGYMENEVKDAILKGELLEADVDKCVKNILKLIFKERKKPIVDMEKHHQLAYEVATNSFVLLKNEDEILPLKEKEKVLFVGDLISNIRYQGAGSSHINPYKLENPIEYINKEDYVAGCDQDGNTNDKLLAELQKAKDYQKVVVFAGLLNKDESEGFDRESMAITSGHLKMIEEVCKYNKNVIVVLVSGSAVELPFINEIKGLLYVGLAGQCAGKAIIDTIYGKVNPSGHLAETWPISYEDFVVSNTFGEKNPIYREGIYVGYRYYQKANIKVCYPFGYGLSYSKFTLSDFVLNDDKVTFKITNKSDIAGKALVQYYIGLEKEDCYFEKRSLKHFIKVLLNPHESKILSFNISKDDFVVYNHGWVVRKGKYNIYIGFDCENICYSNTIDVEGCQIDDKLPNWYLNPNGHPKKEDYEILYGKKIEEEQLIKGKYTMNNSLEELKEHSLIMKLVYKVIEMVISIRIKGKADYSNPDYRMLMESVTGSSLNSMKISGQMNNYVIEGMLDIANGHFFKGIYQMMLKRRI